jgi:hypothetical protein
MRMRAVSGHFMVAISMLIISGCNQNDANTSDMLNVVDIRQATPYTCGVSAAQAILSYYGIDTREDLLAQKFGTTETSGTSPAQIIAGLESFGLVAVMKEDTTLDDLRSNIQQKTPTMVAIQAWLEKYPPPDWNTDWENGHWVIVIGMDDSNVYFEDPSLLGSRGWLSQPEFLARWHDYSGEAPCCAVNDKTYIHLSISVKGIPAETGLYTHIN